MLVSVIIPCHNCSETIDRAVDSVFSQTHENWELILVNNNSKDNTWEKLLDIKDKNPNKAITVLDEPRKGAPAARNKGLYEAKGEWIQFLDSDDELLPQKIEKQLEITNAFEVDVIYSPYYKVKTVDNISSKNQISIEEDMWSALISSKAGITSANLFRRRAVLSVNGWDELLTSSQEYDLMYRIASSGSFFSSLNVPLTHIHFVENSISNVSDRNKLTQRLNNYVELRVKMLEEVKEKENYETYFIEYNKAIAAYSHWILAQGLISAIFSYNKFSKDKPYNKLKITYSMIMFYVKKKIKQ